MVLVVIASDHGGFEHKQAVVARLQNLKYEVEDLGTNSAESVDYPDFAHKVCEKVEADSTGNTVGILVCGTGLGMDMAANKHKGIRSALCHNEFTAKMSREHNNANVLCMGGRVIDVITAKKLAEIFLTTKFEGGRHERRVNNIPCRCE